MDQSAVPCGHLLVHLPDPRDHTRATENCPKAGLASPTNRTASSPTDAGLREGAQSLGTRKRSAWPAPSPEDDRSRPVLKMRVLLCSAVPPPGTPRLG